MIGVKILKGWAACLHKKLSYPTQSNIVELKGKEMLGKKDNKKLDSNLPGTELEGYLFPKLMIPINYGFGTFNT